MPDAVTPKTVSAKTVNPKTMAKKTATAKTAPKHMYDAEAIAFKGDLLMPVNRKTETHARVSLPGKGGYKSAPPSPYNLEAVISFTSGYTQVSGIEGTKGCKGYATLSTAVVQGLNILEILACDRVVSQIATHYSVEGDTPEIIFLGTRFENLRIGGHPVHITLDIDTIGPRPVNGHYLDDPCFLSRVGRYAEELRSYGSLPLHIREQYTGTAKTAGNRRSIDFSLVTKIAGDFPGKVYGHVIDIPHFGTIELATVKIISETNGAATQTTVELKMLEVKLGCIGHGNGDVAFCKTGGAGKGGTISGGGGDGGGGDNGSGAAGTKTGGAGKGGAKSGGGEGGDEEGGGNGGVAGTKTGGAGKGGS